MHSVSAYNFVRDRVSALAKCLEQVIFAQRAASQHVPLGFETQQEPAQHINGCCQTAHERKSKHTTVTWTNGHQGPICCAVPDAAPGVGDPRLVCVAASAHGWLF